MSFGKVRSGVGVIVKWIWVVALLVILLPRVALAEDCAVWDQLANLIYDPQNGDQIGVANMALERAENMEGVPLSQLGWVCVIGSEDGKYYHPDDLGEPEEEDNDTPPNDCPCTGLPFCWCDTGSGGGGSGNGGGGGSGSGGGGSGSGGKSTTGDAARALSIEEGPAAQEGGGDGGVPPTLSTFISNSDEAENGRETADGGHAQNISALMLSNAYPLSYWGLGKSYLIEPRRVKQQYPNMMVESDDDRPKMGEAYDYDDNAALPDPDDVGVDDEVIRQSNALYQPIRRMGYDFLNDQTTRDDYLNHATTLIGVTTMAMGFLDKTLSTGLALANEEEDRNVTMHLLKQIGWTTARLSNDDRSQLHRDVDEKLEACLEYAIVNGHGKKIEGNDTTRERIWVEECADDCGDLPSGEHDYSGSEDRETGKLEAGNGTYRYCVCCAETSPNLNALGDQFRSPEELTSEENEKLFTLAERAFIGSRDLKSSDSTIRDTLKLFKRLYGDVVLTNKDGRDGIENFVYYTQMPDWSPRMVVALYKNRCYHTDGPPRSDLCERSTCHGQEDEDDFGVKYGICPSLGNILENWEDFLDGQTSGDYERWWTEAGYGHQLTGREIKEFLALNGDPSKSVACNKQKLVLRRVVESWCESSAVAAAMRMHATFSAAFLDHINLSQALTDREKAKLFKMMDRYSQNFALTEADAASKFVVEASLAGMSIQYDRWKVAALGTSGVAAINMASKNTAMSGISGFLSAGQIISTLEGDSSQSVKHHRVKSFTDVFGKRIGPTVTKLERYRLDNDPIRRRAGEMSRRR